MVLSMRGDLTLSTPLAPLLDALIAWASRVGKIDKRRRLACDLFAQSRFEVSPTAQVLTLVTALEVLAQRKKRTGRAAELVEHFLREAESARTTHKGQGPAADIPSLNALAGALGELRNESIASSVQSLAGELGSGVQVGGSEPADVVKRAYKARSDLLHGGTTKENLGQLLDPLQELVARLCAQSAPDIKPPR
jgi:hypothetical protein